MKPKDISPWAEKHRPSQKSNYVFPNNGISEQFDEWVDDGIFPSLLLVGEPGTGKTSMGHLLIETFGILPADILRIDGSRENKIEVVRERIEPFTKVKPMLSPIRLVVIEECHRYSADAQAAMLEILEHRTHCRFIFTTNYPRKMIPPILSRLSSGTYYFSGHEKSDVLFRLFEVLDSEGVEFDPEDDEALSIVTEIYEKCKPDMRAMISQIQRSVIKGKLTRVDFNTTSSTEAQAWSEVWNADDVDLIDAFDICHLVDDDNYNDFYTLVYTNAHRVFPSEVLYQVYPMISDSLFKAKNTFGGVADQEIHMKALISSFISLLQE